MPRRSRGHVYKKRTTATSEQMGAGAQVLEPADETVETPELQALPIAPPAQPASTFIRGRTVAEVVPIPAPRAQRALVTDYGYIIDELKRIGITFAGLIILLIIIAYRLR